MSDALSEQNKGLENLMKSKISDSLEEGKILAAQREKIRKAEIEFNRIKAEASNQEQKAAYSKIKAAMYKGLDNEQSKWLDQYLSLGESLSQFGQQYDKTHMVNKNLEATRDILLNKILAKGRNLGVILFRKRVFYESRNSMLVPTQEGNFTYQEGHIQPTTETTKTLIMDTETGKLRLGERSMIAELNAPIMNWYDVEISEEELEEVTEQQPEIRKTMTVRSSKPLFGTQLIKQKGDGNFEK